MLASRRYYGSRTWAAGKPRASARHPVRERNVSLLVLHGEAPLDDALGGQLRGRGAHPDHLEKSSPNVNFSKFCLLQVYTSLPRFIPSLYKVYSITGVFSGENPLLLNFQT